jgi:phage shock protein PspC (stress-responsive transcriptional regulator)
MTDSSRRQKKLYKDPHDKMIAGVASGVAKYFDIDTTLVRVIWVVVGLGGVGILLYVVLWVVLENEPADLEVPTETDAGAAGIDETTPAEATAGQPSETGVGGEPSETGEDAEPEPRTGDDSVG